MKDKSLKRRLSSLFRQRIPGKDPSDDLLELEKAEGVIEDILRWEDDGGQILGIIGNHPPHSSEPYDR